MYFIAFLLATYNAFDQPAFDSSVIEYFHKDELISINSSIEVILSSCNVVGPLIAGFLIHWAGVKHAIPIIACFYMISFFLIKLSKPIQISSLNKKFEDIGELIYEHTQLIKEGFVYLLSPGCPILLTILMTFLSNVLLGPIDTLILFLGRDVFHLNSENYASIISAISLMVIFGILVLPTQLKKLDTFFIMISALAIQSFSYLAIGFLQMTTCVFVAYSLIMISSSMYVIFARTYRQTIVPNALAGRVASITRSIGPAGVGLGAVLSSVLLKFAPVEIFFILNGFLMLIVAVISYRLQKKFGSRLL